MEPAADRRAAGLAGALTGPAADVPALAAGVGGMVGVLLRRFRAEGGMPVAQMTTLGWLLRDGPSTTAKLAAMEKVRHQSMAQTIRELETAGFVARREDPADRRQSLIEITARGRARYDELLRVERSWLAEAIEATCTEDDRETLAHALELLRRLADHSA